MAVSLYTPFEKSKILIIDAGLFFSQQQRIWPTSKKWNRAVHAADRITPTTTAGMRIDVVLFQHLAASIATEEHHTSNVEPIAFGTSLCFDAK